VGRNPAPLARRGEAGFGAALFGVIRFRKRTFGLIRLLKVHGLSHRSPTDTSTLRLPTRLQYSGRLLTPISSAATALFEQQVMLERV